MKKLGILLGCCCLGMQAYSEEMQFVTTLSSPMGTFAMLETADPSAVTNVTGEGSSVNFCNSLASVGTVSLKGADAFIQTLALKSAAELGGDTPEFRVSGALDMSDGAELTGARLMASVASVENASSAKSRVEETLYMAQLSVMGAKTDGLTITGQVQTGANASGSTGRDMFWSNEYPCTYGTTASGSTGELESVNYGSWSQGTASLETCNDNAYEEFTVTASNAGGSNGSCRDCRVEDYYSTELGNDGFWEECPYNEDYYWAYSRPTGEGYVYPARGEFGSWVKTMLQTDPAGGDLSDFETTLTQCDSNNRLPSQYQSGDYSRWMGYKEYFSAGGSGNNWQNQYLYRCYFAAAKVTCRSVSWTYKQSSSVECTGSETEFADSYLLKSE